MLLPFKLPSQVTRMDRQLPSQFFWNTAESSYPNGSVIAKSSYPNVSAIGEPMFSNTAESSYLKGSAIGEPMFSNTAESSYPNGLAIAEPILFRILPSKLREQNPYKLKVQRGKENKHEHVKKIENTLLYLLLRL